MSTMLLLDPSNWALVIKGDTCSKRGRQMVPQLHYNIFLFGGTHPQLEEIVMLMDGYCGLVVEDFILK